MCAVKTNLQIFWLLIQKVSIILQRKRSLGLYNSFLAYKFQIMGNKESIDYSINDYKQSERLGVYRHIPDDSQVPVQENYLIEIRKEMPSEAYYKKWMNGLKQIEQSLCDQDVIFLPIRHKYQHTEFCGSGGLLYLVYDDIENSLKEEVASRRKNQHYYNEEEIWTIFYSLLRGCTLYEGKGRKLGDINPRNIFVTSKGLIKIISVDSMPFQLTNFEKIVESITSEVYLAPQEVDQKMIETGVCSIKELSKAEVYSLGMTMLEIITLQNCCYLYIRNPLRISQDKLKVLLKLVSNKYSTFLYEIIANMVDINPHKRRSFLEIYQILRPFANQIENNQPFFQKMNSNSNQISQAQVSSTQFSFGVDKKPIDENSIPINYHNKASQGQPVYLGPAVVNGGRFNAPHSPPTQQVFGIGKR